MRPKFFPASVLPVLAGSAWGFMVAGQFDLSAFVLALLATVCVHAGANVLNDVGDDAGGTDRQNEDRIYPYTGGTRFIQAGIMSANGMARLGISLPCVAFHKSFSIYRVKLTEPPCAATNSVPHSPSATCCARAPVDSAIW